MRVDVFTILRNEIKLAPFFMRHYQEIADRIFVFDDSSTDGTREFMREAGAIIMPMEEQAPDGIDDQYFAGLFGTAYKFASRRREVDWIICVDSDEFIYHKWLHGTLSEASKRGSKVICTEGWNMVSESFPVGERQIYEYVTNGFRDGWFDKPCIFDPSIDIHFMAGRHNLSPEFPQTVDRETGIKLLHFRYLGEKYMLERNARNAERLSEKNKGLGYGTHNLPGRNGPHTPNWWKEEIKKAVRVV